MSDIKDGLNVTGGASSENGLKYIPFSEEGITVTGACFHYPVWIKCPFCDDFYKIDLGKDTTSKIISKPGAVLRVISTPFPIGIQEQMNHNFRCPVRPGGVRFSVWLKYKIRKFVEYWLS